ncbi:unnamed protein product [Acanthoscelides obtectus]|uniref:Uncharacterized protein n=1 Tax=Acanthoscelides obtectus TaxID=200917 RepID=A0A9P0PZ72_ACAOB|nr:unnamed protein product [Acanthoscelides obtectus]CAK1625981.1 hypothetical protein AOBTE_LOCUS3519 [Acanthoscelides obtectus]
MDNMVLIPLLITFLLPLFIVFLLYMTACILYLKRRHWEKIKATLQVGDKWEGSKKVCWCYLGYPRFYMAWLRN